MDESDDWSGDGKAVTTTESELAKIISHLSVGAPSNRLVSSIVMASA